jgi:hypothetical protein
MLSSSLDCLDRILDFDKCIAHIIGLGVVSAAAFVAKHHRNGKRATLIN